MFGSGDGSNTLFNLVLLDQLSGGGLMGGGGRRRKRRKKIVYVPAPAPAPAPLYNGQGDYQGSGQA